MAKRSPAIISSADGTPVYNTAQTKARFGRNDWAVWKGRDGHDYAARLTPEIIKMAMLATGTKSHWLILAGGTGVGHLQSWSMGCMLRRNWRFLAGRG